MPLFLGCVYRYWNSTAKYALRQVLEYRLIVFKRHQIVAARSMICSAILRWVPIASIETKAPVSHKEDNTDGRTVSSLVLSSTGFSATQISVSDTHALRIYSPWHPGTPWIFTPKFLAVNDDLIAAQGFDYVASAAIETCPELSGIDRLYNTKYRVTAWNTVAEFQQSGCLEFFPLGL